MRILKGLPCALTVVFEDIAPGFKLRHVETLIEASIEP